MSANRRETVTEDVSEGGEMTTVADAQEMWNVMVVGEDQSKLFRLPVSTTVGEIIQKWRTEDPLQSEWRLRRFNGPPLLETTPLTEVGETEKGSKITNLIVERVEVGAVAQETVPITVTLMGDVVRQQVIHVNVDKTPQDVHSQVREVVDLPPERVFRLRTPDAKLNYELSLAEQDVVAGSSLIVELAYQVNVTTHWSPVVERSLLFATDCLMEVAPDDDHVHRLFFEGRHVDMGRSLLAALPTDALKQTQLDFELEYQRSVTVYMKGVFKQFIVWPEDQLSRVIPSLPADLVLKYEGRQVFLETTFQQMGLEDRGLISECVTVPVQFSCGDVRAVWVSKLGSVSDLRNEVQKTEMSGGFRLKLGKRVLEMEDSIDKTIAGSLVAVEPVEHTFVVSMPDRSVRWTSTEGELRFQQFGRQLLQRGGLQWMDVGELQFQCDGCGRHIHRREEKHQLLPAACCHVRSLRLTYHEPLVVKDEVAQGRPKLDQTDTGTRSMSTRTKVFGERDRTQATSCQATVDTVEETTQSEAGLGGQVISTQHPPPPPPELRPFRFYDYTRGFEGKDVSLLLSSAPTIGELRVAVSRCVGWKPEETEISRNVGDFRHVRVVHAWDGGHIFTTEDGRRMGPWLDVKNKRREDLTDDAAPFLLPLGRRLVLHVKKR